MTTPNTESTASTQSTPDWSLLHWLITRQTYLLAQAIKEYELEVNGKEITDPDAHLKGHSLKQQVNNIKIGFKDTFKTKEDYAYLILFLDLLREISHDQAFALEHHAATHPPEAKP